MTRSYIIWMVVAEQPLSIVLLSATHSTLGDVMESLREQNVRRVHMIPEDEILLRYAIPHQELGPSIFDSGPFELQFLGWSTGYYLWRDEIWCEAWSLDPELALEPGHTATFDAVINNMTNKNLPAEAQVWFVLKDEAGTRIGPLPALGLPPATPTWYPFNWQAPEDFTPGTYTYAPRVYVGDTDVIWDDLKLWPRDPRSMMTAPAKTSGCNN